jgi:LPS sulfotransferase NodH
MTRPTYLILATPRSGSTLLGQGLQASGVAGDPKEFFGHRMPYWMERWGTPDLPAYVARLIAERATPNGVFGAKLLYGQLPRLEGEAGRDPRLAVLSPGDLLIHLFPELHIIWVSREDKLRQAISWYKARQSGVWGDDGRRDTPKLGAAWRGDDPLSPSEPAFDYDAIAALLRQSEAEDAAIGRLLADSGIPSRCVTYETFSPAYEETVFTLLAWMGIPIPAGLRLPHPRTVKLADDRTNAWVARFREMEAGAAG